MLVLYVTSYSGARFNGIWYFSAAVLWNSALWHLVIWQVILKFGMNIVTASSEDGVCVFSPSILELTRDCFSKSLLDFSADLYACVCPNRFALNRQTSPSMRTCLFMASSEVWCEWACVLRFKTELGWKFNYLWCIAERECVIAALCCTLLVDCGTVRSKIRATCFFIECCICRHSTVKLRLSGRWLSGSTWPLGKICREFYKTNLPWNYRLSDQVQYSVMACRTANQAWSKGSDAVHTVNDNSRTSKCQCSLLKKKSNIPDFVPIRVDPRLNGLNFICHLIILNGWATIVVFGRLRVG